MPHDQKWKICRTAFVAKMMFICVGRRQREIAILIDGAGIMYLWLCNVLLSMLLKHLDIDIPIISSPDNAGPSLFVRLLETRDS